MNRAEKLLGFVRFETNNYFGPLAGYKVRDEDLSLCAHKWEND